MAGTRLYIQSLVLVELLVLAAWSFFHGLCRNGDLLCHLSIGMHDAKDFELPSLESPHQLTLVQVEKDLSPDTKLKWRKNPDAGVVCSQPDSPLVQGQSVWFCPPSTSTDPSRVVVRESSTLIFSKESDLPSITMPKVVTPFALNVRLVLEETTDVAHQAQALASTLQDTVRNLRNWPCVDDVQVDMSVVEPYTNQWIVMESIAEETGETIPAYLPPLGEREAELLMERLNLDDNALGYELLLYVPALQHTTTVAFRVGDSQLLMVGEWEAAAVSDWLLSKMGIPVEAVDGDGTLPAWYDEWYWHQASQKLSMEIHHLFSRVQHLIKEPLELGPSTSSRQHYVELTALYHQLKLLLHTSRIQSDFPIEHYAAIFAPLLFPLLLPFLIGTIKEVKRYKEKKRGKLEQGEKTEKLE